MCVNTITLVILLMMFEQTKGINGLWLNTASCNYSHYQQRQTETPFNTTLTFLKQLLLQSQNSHLLSLILIIKSTFCHFFKLELRTISLNVAGPGSDTHSVDEAVVAVLLRVQHAIFDEHWDRPQDERHEKVHVDEVASAVQLPVHTNTHQYCCMVKTQFLF